MPEELKRPVPRPVKNTSKSSRVDTVTSAPSDEAVEVSENSTKPRDLDRCRAKAAWEAIQEIDAGDKKYGSLARKMPTLIQVNGLAQTLAFLKAKNEDYHQKIFTHLSNWVCQQLHFQQGNLLDNVLQINSQAYRRATAESLSFLQWLKRFAEAKIDQEV